ncbi:MAG: ERCC4 domain-containing protein [Nanoarchaeota archaeon]
MIVIDTREPEEISLYLALHNIAFCRKKCVIGDFHVNGIVIERKTWTDFFTSYGNGRLYKQMLQLYQHCDSILILEGFHFDWLQNKEAFYSILCTLSFRYKVKVVFTGDAQHTAAFLTALERITRQSDRLQSPSKLLPKGVTISQTKKRILCCFPSIGDRKANRILEECANLRRLFIAPPKELERYGIGKKGQKAFEEILDT